MHIAECVMDLSFVVDHSGSIKKNNPPGIHNWQFIIDFMASVIPLINVGPDTTHVGAVSFGMQIELNILCTHHLPTYVMAISEVGIFVIAVCAASPYPAGSLQLSSPRPLVVINSRLWEPQATSVRNCKYGNIHSSLQTTVYSYTIRCTQYDRLSQQQLSFLLLFPQYFRL